MNLIIYNYILYIITNIKLDYVVDWVLPWWVFGLCFSIIKGKNPVMSLMYLISLFLTGIILMLYSQIKFMAFIYMVVYIGAIAILFLFVLMLLNIVGIIKKENEISVKWKWYLWEGMLLFMLAELLITCIIDETIFIFTKNTYFVEKTAPAYYTIVSDLLKTLDPIGWGDINTISLYLYETADVIFILGGILLLVAMIGAIVITLSTTEPMRKKLEKFTYCNFVKEKS